MNEYFMQNGNYDCLLACIASHVGAEIDELFDEEETQKVEDEKGAHGDNFWALLRGCGIVENDNLKRVYLGNSGNNNAVKQLLWGRCAFLQVPSLNYEKGSHIVYWDGYKLHDPSNKNRYLFLHIPYIEIAFLLIDP